LTGAKTEPLNIILKATIEQQKVTVSADNAGVSTDPETMSNVLKVPTRSVARRPEDLVAALQALAASCGAEWRTDLLMTAAD
jgi:hypothetical protein